MENPTGVSNDGILRLNFSRRLTLQLRESVITSDTGLLAYRELDDALGLSTMAKVDGHRQDRRLVASRGLSPAPACR